MSVIVNNLPNSPFRHTIDIDGKHSLFTDLSVALGGDDSAPDPHDYFDSALGACKALTVTLYARQHDIPLTGITVAIERDGTQERTGKYGLNVTLTLKGPLTDEQRTLLHRIADRCPVHKLMTSTEVTIETHLAEDVVNQ